MERIVVDAIQLILNYHVRNRTNATATPTFRDILIADVVVEGAGDFGNYVGLPESVVKNFTLRNVSMRGPTTTRSKTGFAACEYVDGTW